MTRRIALLLLAGWTATGAFYEWGGSAARGVRELKKGRNQEAVGSLRQGRKELPHSAAVRYDQALAFRGVGLRDSAFQAYQNALSSPELSGDRAKSSAAYNLGNESMRQDQIEVAKRLYRESLRTEPNRMDAKKNLEEALRRSRQKPPSAGAGAAGQTGEPPPGGRGQAGRGQAGVPPGELPPSKTSGSSPSDLGREVSSRAEAEHWLDALEAERQAARERERAGGTQERGQRDW